MQMEARTMKNQFQIMSHDDYTTLLNGPHESYYTGRWEYYKEVISLIGDHKFERFLELGPGYMPIVKNSDVILNPLDDQFGKPDGVYGKVFTFDATQKPWPIMDKSYDLFIALQVWEHLDNKQSRAFREVMRIANAAILSFPYGWDGGKEKPSHRAHRDIDMELIRDWTLGITPIKTIEIPRTGPEFSKGPRVICFWDFTAG